MKSFIKTLLREQLETSNKKTRLTELFLLMEKKIEVGPGLAQKLHNVNTPFSKKLLTFLNSDDINDKANADYIEYSKENKKLVTIGHKDGRGNDRVTNLGLNKALKSLGFNASLKSLGLDVVQDYEIEDVVVHFMDADTSGVEIVSGAELVSVFDCGNQDGKSGSCMVGKESSFFDIYEKNPNQVKALVLKNPESGKIRGRALLWKMNNGKYFMDKVYVVDEYKEARAIFYKYADENGFEVAAPSSGVRLENGGGHKTYPYVDTFIYYTPSNGVLSTKRGLFILQGRRGQPSIDEPYVKLMTDEMITNELPHVNTKDAAFLISNMNNPAALLNDPEYVANMTEDDIQILIYSSKQPSELIDLLLQNKVVMGKIDANSPIIEYFLMYSDDPSGVWGVLNGLGKNVSNYVEYSV